MAHALVGVKLSRFARERKKHTKISAGDRDDISPRARLEYYPGSYAADVLDSDGYSFEVADKSY